MTINSLFRPFCVGALAVVLASPAFGQFVEAEAVQKVNADPSPGVGASNVNDYINQDEQVNLDADTGNIRVLRTDQKSLVNDFVTRIFELKNVDPRELREPIRSVVGLEGGSAEVIYDAENKKNYIQVIAPAFMMDRLASAIAALDVSWLTENDTGSAYLQYKGRNRNVASEFEISIEPGLGFGKLGVDRLAAFWATADTGVTNIDTLANTAHRIDEPFRIDRYLYATALVDQPANQVELEIKIYEVASNDDLKLGLDYINWSNGPGRNLFQFIYQGVDANSRANGATSVFDPFIDAALPGGLPPGTTQITTDFDQTYRAVNYLLTSNYVDFLEIKGKARVLTQQTIQVKSANTATVSFDDQVVALVSSPGDIGDKALLNWQGVALTGLPQKQDRFQTGNPDPVPITIRDSTRRLHYKNAGRTGTFVDVTPFIGVESMELSISIRIGDLNGITPTGQPIINTRTITTHVRLFDGETHVIGGLKRRHDIKETGKAPGLGDIPILGYLFGGETDIKRFDDVVVTLTPHFKLPSQIALGSPQRVKTIAEVVEGGRSVQLPSNPVGYDQWLLDADK